MPFSTTRVETLALFLVLSIALQLAHGGFALITKNASAIALRYASKSSLVVTPPLVKRQTETLPLTMRAIVATAAKPSGDLSAVELVENHPLPKRPSNGEVLIRVEASSVNPVDFKILEIGSGLPIRFPHILGFDLAGTVVAVGNECKRLQVGDQVWADMGKLEIFRGGELGAWAEYVVADEKQVGVKPASMTFAEAGTIPLVGLTALQAFRKMGGPGAFLNTTVVITSGSGGTGFIAIQMARLYGATRIITATSSKNFDFVKSLGATDVVDYHKESLWSILSNNSVDFVYDNFGEPGTADDAMPSLRSPGGVFLFLPGRGGSLCKHPKPGVKQIDYGLTNAGNHEDLDELRVLIDRKDGGIRSQIQKTFTLNQSVLALNASMSGNVVGKVSICVVCNTTEFPADAQDTVRGGLMLKSIGSGVFHQGSVLDGDLIFVQPPLNSQSPFDQAILSTGLATIHWLREHGLADNSTPNTTATHVAIAWRSSNGSLHYVQALPSVGVVITPEGDFMHMIPPNTTLYHRRVEYSSLKEKSLLLGKKAASIAKALQGHKYALDFEPPSSGKFYCSSLVEHAFNSAANLSGGDKGVFLNQSFKLIFEPFDYWRSYYAKMGKTLPVNRTGSNPTLLLHSPAVTKSHIAMNEFA